MQNSILNFEGIEKSIEGMKESWANFRNDLNMGKYSPQDVDSALNSVFLKAFDDFFTTCKNLEGLTKKLRYYADYKIMRGTKLNDGEYQNTVAYSRLLPNKNFMKDDNRFSPKDLEWLYLAIGHETAQSRECCIKECRAGENDKFAIVSFEIAKKNYNKIIVDLTVGVEYDYTVLEHSLKNAEQISYEKALQAMNYFTDNERQMRKSKLEK